MTDFPIDALRAVARTDTRPAYVQIAEQLRRAIRESKVEPGTIHYETFVRQILSQ